MNSVSEINMEQFEAQVLKSEVPVLIDFYADWCMPCRMMAPVLKQVAERVAGRARVVKVNVDEAPALAQAFRISSIPALVVVSGGQIAGQTVGMTTADALVEMIDGAAARISA